MRHTPSGLAENIKIRVEAYRTHYGCNYINVMPNNLYGPGENYHPEFSHVVDAPAGRIVYLSGQVPLDAATV